MELQRLREECRELTLEMRRKKDDLQATNQEILNAQGLPTCFWVRAFRYYGFF